MGTHQSSHNLGDNFQMNESVPSMLLARMYYPPTFLLHTALTVPEHVIKVHFSNLEVDDRFVSFLILRICFLTLLCRSSCLENGCICQKRVGWPFSVCKWIVPQWYTGTLVQLTEDNQLLLQLPDQVTANRQDRLTFFNCSVALRVPYWPVNTFNCRGAFGGTNTLTCYDMSV